MLSRSRTSPPPANGGCCEQQAGARRVVERPLRAGMRVQRAARSGRSGDVKGAARRTRYTLCRPGTRWGAKSRR
eukprot:scaffold38225_cov59-Phaeocystis_antarctica.AAC.3